MKTKNLISLALLLIFVLPGCKKYPDGPDFSLLSKKERLSNTWIINQYFEDGVDKSADATNILKDYVMTINKSGSYSLYYRPFNLFDYNETGTWTFTDNNATVHFQKSNSSSTTDWKILRLMEGELWGEYMDSTKTIEVHLLPQ